MRLRFVIASLVASSGIPLLPVGAQGGRQVLLLPIAQVQAAIRDIESATGFDAPRLAYMYRTSLGEDSATGSVIFHERDTLAQRFYRTTDSVIARAQRGLLSEWSGIEAKSRPTLLDAVRVDSLYQVLFPWGFSPQYPPDSLEQPYVAVLKRFHVTADQTVRTQCTASLSRPASGGQPAGSASTLSFAIQSVQLCARLGDPAALVARARYKLGFRRGLSEAHIDLAAAAKQGYAPAKVALTHLLNAEDLSWPSALEDVYLGRAHDVDRWTANLMFGYVVAYSDACSKVMPPTKRLLSDLEYHWGSLTTLWSSRSGMIYSTSVPILEGITEHSTGVYIEKQYADTFLSWVSKILSLNGGIRSANSGDADAWVGDAVKDGRIIVAREGCGGAELKRLGENIFGYLSNKGPVHTGAPF